MNTKLIAALIVLLLAFAGYRLYVYYEAIENDPGTTLTTDPDTPFDPKSLRGMPSQLERSLEHAQSEGAEALGKWLVTYGPQLQDPRKAWIQLDYCRLLARENPQKAREVYEEVRDRLDESSPVYPRVKQLQRTFR